MAAFAAALAGNQKIERLTAPQYSGDSDLKDWISLFDHVAEANEWRPAAARLHCRQALDDPVQDCANYRMIKDNV